ncbi:MAG: hypothetical protein MJ252_04950 [archaeon]|nr:hypothetical protein [archaeon]
MGCEEIKEAAPPDGSSRMKGNYIPPSQPSSSNYPPPTPVVNPVTPPPSQPVIQPEPAEGLILRRTKGFLESDEFFDCVMTNEEELQKNIKYYIPSYLPDPKNNGETIRNMEDEILTHTFHTDWSKQVIIAVNGVHVTKIEIKNGKYFLTHDETRSSKYFYEAFIVVKKQGVKDIEYNSPKPAYID